MLTSGVTWSVSVVDAAFVQSMGTSPDMSAVSGVAFHLGTMHPGETVGVLVLALGPIAALGFCVLATVRKERRVAEEEGEADPVTAERASHSVS